MTTNYTDTATLTIKLQAAGADRAAIITIIDGYGGPIDWSHYSMDSIIGEVWQSDINSGDDPSGWIINEILRGFNLEEVTA